MRAGILLGMMFLLASIQSSIAQESSSWRENEIDPSTWDDGPTLEGSPMDAPREGDALILLNLSYVPGHGDSRVEGEVVVELFEEWAPLTTTNIIEHVESGLYDGIFFHRVIDDFVTQSGDPTCETVGIYPGTNPSCGSGGTGETIPLELDENLSHVDGAIGMARSTDPDSADSQWYICDGEQHGLDPENRDDEGYATFGVVRDGMSHIRAIASTPTSDEPTGSPLQNPFSTAGRPVYEVHINSATMLGVVGLNESSNESAGNDVVSIQTDDDDSLITTYTMFGFAIGISLALVIISTRVEEPKELVEDAEIISEH